MKQHPVPQNISSYQFRLIGEMTLKQFLELIGGIIAGWLIFSLKISPIIKLPLAFFAGMAGVALAFLPIEERPLDTWVINFFKSVYSPTQFIWKKNNPVPAIFLKQSYHAPLTPQKEKKLKKDEGRLEEYLKTLPSPVVAKAANKLEQQENIRLKSIFSLLGNVPQQEKTKKPVKTLDNAVIKTKVRKLGPKTDVKMVKKTETGSFKKETVPQEELKVFKKPLKKEVFVGPPVVKPAPRLNPPILVDSTRKQKLDPSVAAQFSTTLPIPQAPEVPNLIVGMVINEYDKIITGALIEILDSKEDTVRALKTNKLGQFFSASPLKNGSYQIKIDHPDYEFDIINFKAEGKIIQPIKIKAKKRINS
jgi:hypothetical protein